MVYGLNRLSDDLDFDNQAGLDLDHLAENLASIFIKHSGMGMHRQRSSTAKAHFAGYTQSGQQEPVIVGLGQKEGFASQRLRKRVYLSSPEGPWFALIYLARIQAPLLDSKHRPLGSPKELAQWSLAYGTWQKETFTMNQKPRGFLLSMAINGFLQFKTAEGLSPNTIDSYRRILELWMERQTDINITKVTSKDIRDYMNYMRLEYVPRRITGGNERKLSSKSIRNIYVAFKAFFRWAKVEFHIPSPMENFPTPRYTSPEIIPFNKDEVEKLLKACDLCDEAHTDRRRKFTMRRATAHRDRAIILVLLDTGLRVSELCSICGRCRFEKREGECQARIRWGSERRQRADRVPGQNCPEGVVALPG